jgi:hypothetical protein
VKRRIAAKGSKFLQSLEVDLGSLGKKESNFEREGRKRKGPGKASCLYEFQRQRWG